MFERYFPLINTLHVDWLLRRHQFSSISASAAAARMVSPYSGNNDCPTQARLKEDAEASRKTKQKKSSNKPPSRGDQKALVNVKDASCSLMMGPPTDEWGELPDPGLMLCQTSTREASRW